MHGFLGQTVFCRDVHSLLSGIELVCICLAVLLSSVMHIEISCSRGSLHCRMGCKTGRSRVPFFASLLGSYSLLWIFWQGLIHNGLFGVCFAVAVLVVGVLLHACQGADERILVEGLQGGRSTLAGLVLDSFRVTVSLRRKGHPTKLGQPDWFTKKKTAQLQAELGITRSLLHIPIRES